MSQRLQHEMVIDAKLVELSKQALQKKQDKLNLLKRSGDTDSSTIQAHEKDVEATQKSIELMEKYLLLCQSDQGNNNQDTLKAKQAAIAQYQAALKIKDSKDTNKDLMKAKKIFEDNKQIFLFLGHKIYESLPKKTTDDFSLLFDNLMYLNQVITFLITQGDVNNKSVEISFHLMAMTYEAVGKPEIPDYVKNYLISITELTERGMDDAIGTCELFPKTCRTIDETTTDQKLIEKKLIHLSQICAEQKKALQNFMSLGLNKTSVWSQLKFFTLFDNPAPVDNDMIALKFDDYCNGLLSFDAAIEFKKAIKSGDIIIELDEDNGSLIKVIAEYNYFMENRKTLEAYLGIMQEFLIAPLISLVSEYMFGGESSKSVEEYFKKMRDNIEKHIQTHKTLPVYMFKILEIIWKMECAQPPKNVYVSNQPSITSTTEIPLSPTSSTETPLSPTTPSTGTPLSPTTSPSTGTPLSPTTSPSTGTPLSPTFGTMSPSTLFPRADSFGEQTPAGDDQPRRVVLNRSKSDL